MFENRLRVDLRVTPRHYGQADAFAEPRIANRKCRRLLDRIVPQRQRLDRRWMDVATATYDHILLAAGDVEIACLVDPAEIAGHKPALRVERLFGRLLVVEVA